MKVAVLGLGAMGRELAARAQSHGHDVVGWNRTPREYDIPTVATAPEAVDGAEAVIVVVSDGAAVEALCDESLVAALAPGAVLAVVSTVAPETVRGIAYDHVVDTPVLGAPSAIGSGNARFVVGGSDADLDALDPLLTDLGTSTLRCGPLGSGAVMKIVANLQLVAGVATMAEAVATARGHGIPDEVIAAGFQEFPVVSAASRMRLPAVLDPAHPGWFGAALASKDLRLCIDLAREAGLDLGMAPAALALLDKLEGDWPDFAAVIESL
jgi:3-hydroxyisobutyrate dehydrogenase-like beta-hydroxyacid dehydrogenase